MGQYCSQLSHTSQGKISLFFIPLLFCIFSPLFKKKNSHLQWKPSFFLPTISSQPREVMGRAGYWSRFQDTWNQECLSTVNNCPCDCGGSRNTIPIRSQVGVGRPCNNPSTEIKKPVKSQERTMSCDKTRRRPTSWATWEALSMLLHVGWLSLSSDCFVFLVAA